MTAPKIAARAPKLLELDPGTYYWCACGRSAQQPFCDGSHQGSDFSPARFEISEKKKLALCQCKHTGRAPFCDGSHNKL